jgi:hypothetical protein
MPTAYDNRRHCQDYCTTIAELCGKDPAARRALRHGRGRPLEDCAPMHRYLTVRTAGHPARRAHYTLASLIAAVDPLDALRTPPPPPAPAEHQAGTPRGQQTPGTHPPPAPAQAQAGGGEAGTGQSGEDLDPYDTRQWRARPNLGATLARAVHQAGFHPERTGDLLHVLLKVGEDQMQRRLPSLVSRLLKAGLTPNWPVLLDDLADYRFHPARVALRWQDDFYLATTL